MHIDRDKYCLMSLILSPYAGLFTDFYRSKMKMRLIILMENRGYFPKAAMFLSI